MSTIVSYTLDEIRTFPPLTEKEKRRIRRTIPKEDKDCPFMSKEQLKGFRPVWETHPERYKEIEKYKGETK